MEITFNKGKQIVTSDGKSIENYTGRLKGFYLENEWVLFSKNKEYIDHDWNLSKLMEKHRIELK